MIAGQPRLAVDTARRAYDLCPADDPAAPFAALAYAEAQLLTGEAASVQALLDDADRELSAGTTPMAIFQIAHSRAAFHMVVDEYESARALAEDLVAVARAANAPAMLPFPLATLAEVDFRTGHWNEALARANESATVAEQTGQLAHEIYASLTIAKIAAARGDSATAAGLLDRVASVAAALGTEAMLFYVPAAQAFLAVSEGAYERAVDAGEEVARVSLARGVREPGVIWWPPDLIEAYVRVGRVEDARAALTRFQEEADATGRLWARGAAARCRGLVGPSEDAEASFEEALGLHAETSMPFERARTLLLLGQHRRRAGRRVDARAALAAAHATFERLAAAPWCARASAELRASGATMQSPADRAADTLTPHEWQVAFAVARGATNREAAAQLFLSPKTIDFHLRNIYRKLGIRSRAQLALKVARASDAQAPLSTG
jgi:ATP/maltotriose-dependent transcriptional regulator MalT